MDMRGTTILCAAKNGRVAMAGDGQVTLGQTVLKGTAKKVRRLYKDRVLAGFAGSVADAFAVFSRFEGQLEKHGGALRRAAVELAQEWRTDKALRRLDAVLLVANPEEQLLVSGSGEVLSPDDGLLSTGSGGPFALAAARALIQHTNMEAEEIAKTALLIASEICIYTNNHIALEILP